ncbi:MAG: tetratricopeptide repeat protein [Burkholderiales bacterium]|nr:tetratricopeptide repeat protein [Burkholderiales bacterium]
MSGEDFQPLLAQASAELQAGRPDAAERAYREVLARDANHPVALHFLGLCLMQTGRTQDGLALLARSVELLPGKAKPRHNYAVSLLQAGHLEAAERELLEAIRLEPENAASHHYLGMVRQRLGRLDAAAGAYRAALERLPDDPFVASNLGYCLLEQGKIEAALEWLRRSIAREPRNATAHNNLGSALNAAGDVGSATASYRKAVEIEPAYAVAWYNLALALRESGDDEGALAALRAAAHSGPGFAPAWQALADALAHAEYATWDARAADDVARILRNPAVDAGALAHSAARLLMLDPGFGPAFRAIVEGDVRAGEWFSDDRIGALAHPILLALIEDALVPDPLFEIFLRSLRRSALRAWSAGMLGESARVLELLCALAQQCFLNEYVWPERPDEAADVEGIAAPAGNVLSPTVLALVAAYRPIARIAGLARPDTSSDAFGRLWRRQVEEPAEEARLRAEIPALTPIADRISRAVQEQYERNPYPRWHRLPQTLAAAYPLARALRTLFPQVDATRLRAPESPAVLVAGCGTGYQAAVTAARNPAGRILAIDLSRTSLAYAMRRCRKLGLRNVRFAQADILALDALAERFDWIECSGVLHHLRDPIAGWRVLTALLVPGGVMKIGLYSEIARRGVVAARELVAREGVGSDLDGIRKARQLILDQPEGSAARAATLSADFWSASGMRDLVMHVEEHRFGTEQLAAAIGELGLEFLGFELEDPEVARAYRARFPGDPAAISLENWGRFEAENPAVSVRMYQFWVRKPGERL